MTEKPVELEVPVTAEELLAELMGFLNRWGAGGGLLRLQDEGSGREAVIERERTLVGGRFLFRERETLNDPGRMTEAELEYAMEYARGNLVTAINRTRYERAVLHTLWEEKCRRDAQEKDPNDG